jgi:hypothetical protein
MEKRPDTAGLAEEGSWQDRNFWREVSEVHLASFAGVPGLVANRKGVLFEILHS